MTPVTYESDRQYLKSCTDIASRIAAIDTLITALYDQMLVLAQQEEPVTEVMLNDGQTIIKTVYRSGEQIEKTISVLQKQRNTLANQGRRCVRMQPVSNFNGGRR